MLTPLLIRAHVFGAVGRTVRAIIERRVVSVSRLQKSAGIAEAGRSGASTAFVGRKPAAWSTAHANAVRTAVRRSARLQTVRQKAAGLANEVLFRLVPLCMAWEADFMTSKDVVRAALREAREYILDNGSERTMAPLIQRIDDALQATWQPSKTCGFCHGAGQVNSVTPGCPPVPCPNCSHVETPQVRCTHESGKHTLQLQCTWCNWPLEEITYGPSTPTPPETNDPPKELHALLVSMVDALDKGSTIESTSYYHAQLKELLAAKAVETDESQLLAELRNSARVGKRLASEMLPELLASVTKPPEKTDEPLAEIQASAAEGKRILRERGKELCRELADPRNGDA